MKYTYSELRQKAWKSLEGKWGASALFMLVYMACVYVIELIAGRPTSWRFVLIILMLALLPMAYAIAIAFLDVAKGGAAPKIAALFAPYQSQEKGIRYFLVQFWVGLFTFLWSLLFVIPGIIKAYAYAMTVFIAEENPELAPREAMAKSEEMMKGHKWELFVLDLSFIGWWLLCILTAGLLMLMVMPYMNTAHAHFYRMLKGEDDVVESSSSASGKDVVEASSSAKGEPAAPKSEAPEEGKK